MNYRGSRGMKFLFTMITVLSIIFAATTSASANEYDYHFWTGLNREGRDTFLEGFKVGSALSINSFGELMGAQPKDPKWSSFSKSYLDAYIEATVACQDSLMKRDELGNVIDEIYSFQENRSIGLAHVCRIASHIIRGDLTNSQISEWLSRMRIGKDMRNPNIISQYGGK